MAMVNAPKIATGHTQIAATTALTPVTWINLVVFASNRVRLHAATHVAIFHVESHAFHVSNLNAPPAVLIANGL